MSTLRSKFSNSVLGLHLIWKELAGSAMILCITMLISTFFTSPSVGIEISRTGRCNWKGHIRTLRCSHIRGGNYTGTSPDQMFNTPIIEDIDPEIVRLFDPQIELKSMPSTIFQWVSQLMFHISFSGVEGREHRNQVDDTPNRKYEPLWLVPGIETLVHSKLQCVSIKGNSPPIPKLPQSFSQ